jgi:transposase InsO family protein
MVYRFMRANRDRHVVIEGRRSATEVRQPVFIYIEAYYNRERPHSTLDHAIPNGFNSGEAA